jgi:hypothetical protein
MSSAIIVLVDRLPGTHVAPPTSDKSPDPRVGARRSTPPRPRPRPGGPEDSFAKPGKFAWTYLPGAGISSGDTALAWAANRLSASACSR